MENAYFTLPGMPDGLLPPFPEFDFQPSSQSNGECCNKNDRQSPDGPLCLFSGGDFIRNWILEIVQRCRYH